MNKKGVTLVELLAVVMILAVLSILITPAVIVIRKNILKNTLDSKISMIKTAAKEYASDHLNELPSEVGTVDSGEYVDEEGELVGGEGDNGDITDYTVNKNSRDYCLIRYVRVLISDGYLAPDSNKTNDIVNPLTGESMNDREVCMRFSSNDALNRNIITYIIGEDDLYQ